MKSVKNVTCDWTDKNDCFRRLKKLNTAKTGFERYQIKFSYEIYSRGMVGIFLPKLNTS